MAFSKVISCLCKVLVLAIVVSCAPHSTQSTSEPVTLQQNLKLLLDILKIYTKLQVNRIITTRNETKKQEQEIIVKQFDQLLRYSSDIDSIVEEEEENPSLPLLATKTIIDLTLNQSYHWLKSTLGAADVSQSTLRQTALNLDVGNLSGELSTKLRNPRNPSIIDNAVHCRRIANTVMNMTDPAVKCHILKSVSQYCALLASCYPNY